MNINLRMMDILETGELGDLTNLRRMARKCLGLGRGQVWNTLFDT